MKESRIRAIALAAVIMGITGGIILILGIFVSVIAFEGANDQAYSLRNHFISELGWISRSPAAFWYNWSLALFFVLVSPALILLGLMIRSIWGYLAMFCGACMLLSGILVAAFPLDYLLLHLMAAAVFFFSYFLTMMLFSVAMFLKKNGQRSILLATVGIVCSLVALAFLSFPKGSIASALRNPENFERPTVWWLAVLEWTILFSGLLWGAVATGFLRAQALGCENNGQANRVPAAD